MATIGDDLKKAIVLDLEGVLIDATSAKKAKLQFEESGFPLFGKLLYEEGQFVYLDTPILDTPCEIRKLGQKYEVFYLTGRRKSAYRLTFKRLKEMGFPISPHRLFMKPSIDDDTPQYKLRTLTILQESYDIIAFVDDKQNNRQVAEKLSIPTFGSIPELLNAKC